MQVFVVLQKCMHLLFRSPRFYCVIKCGWFDNKVQERMMIHTLHWHSIDIIRPLLFVSNCATHKDDLSTTKDNIKYIYIWPNYMGCYKFCKKNQCVVGGFLRSRECKAWCVMAWECVLMVLMFKYWAHDCAKSIGEGWEFGSHCIPNTCYGDGEANDVANWGKVNISHCVASFVGTCWYEGLFSHNLLWIHASCMKHSKCDYTRVWRYQPCVTRCLIGLFQRHQLTFVMIDLHTWHWCPRYTNFEEKWLKAHYIVVIPPIPKIGVRQNHLRGRFATIRNLQLHFFFKISFVDIYVKLIVTCILMYLLNTLIIIKTLTIFEIGWQFGARGAWKPNYFHSILRWKYGKVLIS